MCPFIAIEISTRFQRLVIAMNHFDHFCAVVSLLKFCSFACSGMMIGFLNVDVMTVCCTDSLLTAVCCAFIRPAAAAAKLRQHNTQRDGGVFWTGRCL